MSIALKIEHVDGVRLRQQSAHKIERVEGVGVKSGTDWRFDAADCAQDEDYRRVGPDGKKIKLGTYTVHVTAGMRNLVVERKGKVAPLNFKNPAIRNQIRVQYQKLTPTGRKTKEGKEVHEWKNDGPAKFIPPNTFDGVFVGESQRAIVEEMPT